MLLVLSVLDNCVLAFFLVARTVNYYCNYTCEYNHSGHWMHCIKKFFFFFFFVLFCFFFAGSMTPLLVGTIFGWSGQGGGAKVFSKRPKGKGRRITLAIRDQRRLCPRKLPQARWLPICKGWTILYYTTTINLPALIIHLIALSSSY